MIIFEITSGQLRKEGCLVGTGYSGAPGFVNDPTAVGQKAQGPIPPGSYAIGVPENHPELGVFCLPLAPDPSNQMHDRGGFYIHGDNASRPPWSSSEGCIVTGHDIRIQIAQDVDHLLHVVVVDEDKTPVD